MSEGRRVGRKEGKNGGNIGGEVAGGIGGIERGRGDMEKGEERRRASRR